MHFLDQAKIYVALGRRWSRRGQLPAREVHRIRRPRRRQWRQGRRHRFRGRAGPQHPDRLPLHAALQGQARRPRHGQEPHRRQRAGPGHQGAGRNAAARRGARGRAGGLHRGRPARGAARRRHGRARQRQLRHLDQPRPAPASTGHCGAGNGGLAAAQAARRRRAGRPAQRRQVDFHQPGLERGGQSRRLCLHHARAQARRGAPSPARVRARRHSRA